MRLSRRWFWLLLILFLAAIALSLLIDQRVAQWVHRTNPIDRRHWPARIVRLPGDYRFVFVIALLLLFWHSRKWAAALPVFLTGPLVGATYTVLKWIVGRRRPVLEIAPFHYHPFMNGIWGLFRSVSGLSFPSGDAAMAFAAAACVSLALPRWSPAFFLWATLVCSERVLENAHYVSDVVAGAGLGLLCTFWSVRLADRMTSKKPKQTADHPPSNHPQLTTHN